jgi:hypothetical protein
VGQLTVRNAVILATLGPRPEDMHASGAAWMFTVVVGIGFVLVAAWCLAYAVRRRDVLPLVMLGGGLLSVGLEPVVDTMGKVWYAKDNPWVVYTSMGVPQPAFLVLGYALFWGGSVYVGSRFVLNGTSLWKVFATIFAMDLFVEYLGAPILGVGVYYDFSPFNLLGFPLWWAFINGAAGAVGVWLLVVLEPRLTGWRRLGLLPVSATAFGATHATCAWPVWLCMHSDAPHWIGYLAGAYAIAMSFGVVAFANSEIRSRMSMAASPPDAGPPPPGVRSAPPAARSA